MKRVVIMLCALGVLSSVCFGQDMVLSLQKGRTPPPVSSKTVIPLEVRGKVDTVTLAEPSRGVRSKIAIISRDGKLYTFLVRPFTTIYGPDWKAITLDKLSTDQQVRVQYTTTKDGFQVARSIKPISSGNPL